MIPFLFPIFLSVGDCFFPIVALDKIPGIVDDGEWPLILYCQRYLLSIGTVQGPPDSSVYSTVNKEAFPISLNLTQILQEMLFALLNLKSSFLEIFLY